MFVLQGAQNEGQPLLGFLKNEVAERGYKRISACAAYATYRGTLLVRNILAGESEARYRWVIGLDDSFTDPNALRIAMNSRGAEIRLAKLLPNRRFHPKVYFLDSNEEGTATLVIGSCNLTEAALTKNCEVYAIFRAETEGQIREVQDFWDSVWSTGQPATEQKIKDYEDKYKLLSRKAPVTQEEAKNEALPQKIKRAVKESVKTTSLVWIVIGKNTGGGSQLDIVKKLSPFLGLPDDPIQGTTVYLRIGSPTGTRDYQVTFTKWMWRFMNLQQGFNEPLRPDLASPSPYILVIERPKNSGNLMMKILGTESQQAREMIERSKLTGFTDTSRPGPSGRKFGWY
jgi:HKD family nuclease